MSGRGCDPPQPSNAHVNKGKGQMKQKRSHYVLKVTAPTPSLAPLTK